MTTILLILGAFAVGILSTVLFFMIGYRRAENEAFRQFWG